MGPRSSGSPKTEKALTPTSILESKELPPPLAGFLTNGIVRPIGGLDNPSVLAILALAETVVGFFGV